MPYKATHVSPIPPEVQNQSLPNDTAHRVFYFLFLFFIIIHFQLCEKKMLWLQLQDNFYANVRECFYAYVRLLVGIFIVQKGESVVPY